MDIDERPKALNAEMLRGVSLKELEAGIKERAVANVSCSELFNIIMDWFNEQIKQDVITQDERLLAAFVKLLHMQSHAENQSFSLVKVDEVFNEWLENDAIKNPAYRRRYLITQQDVHHLFAEERQCLQCLESPPCPEPQNRHRGSHSPGLSCESGDSNMKTEKESTNLLQDTDHGTRLGTTLHSRSSSIPRIARIDEQSSYFTDTDAIPSQQSNDTYTQEADGDDVIITQESIQLLPDAKISQKHTRASRRRRKHKVHNDVSESTSPPKNYICNRCHKPGHWIQNCPTNLDPNYDQPPPRSYRCNFCGRYGDHFATLCPENPHKGSISKQRKHTNVETRGPRIPSRGGKRHYQSEERSATRARDRYRSRSPKQDPEGHYRSRSPNRGDKNRGDRRQSRRTEDLDVSPYTARARLTREIHMSSDTSQGESSPRSWEGSFSFERRLSRSPPPRRCYSPFAQKPRQRRRDLDKVTNRADEGRLAYDDDVDALVKPKTSPLSPTDRYSQNTTIDREETPKPTVSPVMIDAEDINKVKIKTDEFLRALAAEVMLKYDTSQSKIVNDCEAEAGVDSSPAMEVCIDDNICSNTPLQFEGIAAQPDPKNRPVHCPPFSPVIVSLFNARENPIVNTRAKRQTASQMMEKSEGLWARRIQQASQVAAVHPLLPHCLLNAGEENCVSVI